MRGVATQPHDDARAFGAALAREADAILDEDLAMSAAMTSHGATLIQDGDAVLTHCNTGGLATGGGGTALGAVFAAAAEGRDVRVFANETRPLLQGARLTAWECTHAASPSVLVEGAAASLLSRGACQRVRRRRSHRGQRRRRHKVDTCPILARRAGVPSTSSPRRARSMRRCPMVRAFQSSTARPMK
jgi:hypothetical protein